MPVFGRTRRGDRLAHDSPRPSRAVRRGPALHRSDRGRARRPHHRRRPRSVGRRDRSRARAGARGDSQAFAGARRDAAVACRPQGLERGAVAGRPARLGGRRRMAAACAVGRAAQGRRDAAAGPRYGRPEPDSRRVRGGGETRGAARHRRDRGACGARLSAASVPVAAREPAHRRVRRLAREPDALSARDLRHRARGVSRRSAGRRACVGDRLGRRRLGARRHDRVRACAEAARLRLDRRVVRRGVAVAEDSAVAGLSGAVRAGREARGRDADHRGRPDQRARACEPADRGRRRGFRRDGARDAVRPALAVACGGRARRAGVGAAAVLAFATARAQGVVRRRRVRPALTLNVVRATSRDVERSNLERVACG
ncbi:hypothetical protein BVI2075_570021 [Burkholderia vietnamiensis]|nr:hypothetical protein BVI2075_570021 [Burkholderia vietnamiensis]